MTETMSDIDAEWEAERYENDDVEVTFHVDGTEHKPARIELEHEEDIPKDVLADLHRRGWYVSDIRAGGIEFTMDIDQR